MTSLHNAATNESPPMRKATRLRRVRLDQDARDVFNRFGEEREISTAAVAPSEEVYVHGRAWTPCGRADVR